MPGARSGYRTGELAEEAHAPDDPGQCLARLVASLSDPSELTVREGHAPAVALPVVARQGRRAEDFHGQFAEGLVPAGPQDLQDGRLGSGVVPAALKLIKSKAYSTGVIVSNYTPDGAVKIGDFQLPEPTDAEKERRRKLT